MKGLWVVKGYWMSSKFFSCLRRCRPGFLTYNFVHVIYTTAYCQQRSKTLTLVNSRFYRVVLYFVIKDLEKNFFFTFCNLIGSMTLKKMNWEFLQVWVKCDLEFKGHWGFIHVSFAYVLRILFFLVATWGVLKYF